MIFDPYGNYLLQTIMDMGNKARIQAKLASGPYPEEEIKFMSDPK